GPVPTVILQNGSLTPQFPTLPGSVTSLALTYSQAPIKLPSLGSTLTSLTVSAQGIFQQPGTALTLNTPTSAAAFLAGAHPIVLNNGNDFSSSVGFGIAVTNSGPNQVVINDVNALNFGLAPSTLGNGTLTVTAGAAITQSSPITQGFNAGQTVFRS